MGMVRSIGDYFATSCMQQGSTSVVLAGVMELVSAIDELRGGDA